MPLFVSSHTYSMELVMTNFSNGDFYFSGNPSLSIPPSDDTTSLRRVARDEIEHLRTIRDQILAEINPERKSLPRCISNYVNRQIFQEGRQGLEVYELRALQELLFIHQELQAISVFQVMLKGEKEFLEDISIALLEKHQQKIPKKIIFLATTCPDYPYDEETGKFKFNGQVNNGAGLVGKTILELFLPILGVLSHHQLPSEIRFLYADHEARDSDLQRDMRLDEATFLSRIESSMLDMESIARVTLLACAESVQVCVEKMSEYFDRRVPGDTGLHAKVINGIVAHRQRLYQRFLPQSYRLGGHQFLDRRAKIDISDHRSLGNAVAHMRSQGVPASIITLSTPALAKFLNAEGQSIVPVFNFKKDY